MIDKLLEIYNTKCSQWKMWINTFDHFVNFQPRDSDTMLETYKDVPDYCTWQLDKDNIITISYRYVHMLSSNGDMICLQNYTEEKYKTIQNFNLLGTARYLPILADTKVLDGLLYTEFKSPTGELGYPSPYMLFNIMFNSKDAIKDFRSYITNIVDSYVDLCSRCIINGLPFYEPKRVLTNNYFNDNLYFKDTVFQYSNPNITIDDIAKTWYSSIDGFRRAQGIISAYSSRDDITHYDVELLLAEVNRLKEYARDKCLSLKNANQL